MLGNIKLILGFIDDSKDELILFYIDRFTNIVLEYCNRKELNNSLEVFIEEKVVSIIKQIPNSSGSLTNNGNIKAITRGDVKIEYNVSSNNTSENTNLNVLSLSDKKFLNRYMMVKLC